jgi:hypothetical protein
MTDASAVDARVVDLLDRLKAIGGQAWDWRGQLRLRPLECIPADLAEGLFANADAVLTLIDLRKKRRRRTPAQRFVAKVKAELLAQIPDASHAQRLLADRIAWLSWHVNIFDKRAVASGGLSAHATREYLAYSNSLERCTRRFADMKAETSGGRKSAKREHDWADTQVDRA